MLIGACALVDLTGCGGPVKTDVSGTIRVYGQPPKHTGIQVIFVHPDGALVAAPVAEDGTYKAEGVPSGEVRVCFAYITPEAAQRGAEYKAGGGGRLKKPGDGEAPKVKAPGTPGPSVGGAGRVAPQVKAPGTPEPSTNPIPLALRDTSTSGLTFKVETGKANTFDYDITQ
jgi:hypothetical protein